MKHAEDLDHYVKKQGWKLEIKYNKFSCGFKAGFFNAFGIKWVGTKTFAFFFKLSKDEADAVKMPMTRYESQWKEAVYYIEPGTTKIADYKKLFELAYNKLSGG